MPMMMQSNERKQKQPCRKRQQNPHIDPIPIKKSRQEVDTSPIWHEKHISVIDDLFLGSEKYQLDVSFA